MIPATKILRACAVFTAAGALALNAQTTCTVNMTAPQQDIDGFGFSSAWCGILETPKANSLYGTLGMSLLRVRIDQGGTTNNPGSWDDEITNAAVAHSWGAKVLGTCWTVPSQWQTGNGDLITNDSAAFGNWLGQAANAHNLDWVSAQNEPEGANWSYADMFNFMLKGSPSIGRPVAMPESWGFNDSYSDPVLNNATTDNDTTLVIGHLYAGGLYEHTNAIAHGKHVWMTEFYFDGPNSISSCMQEAKQISDCMNDQFSAYCWWWDYDGDTNTILVTSTGAINLNGYTLGQFAKWIRPGSQRVTSTYNPNAGVFVTAYNVFGNVVIVALNTNTYGATQPFSIQNGAATTMEGYRTSSTQGMADIGSFTVSGGGFTATLPAQSVTTFTQTAGNVANGVYKFINLNSGMCLDVYNSGTTNGTPLQQWPYWAGSNEKWTVTGIGSGQYEILGVQSGLSLDIYGSDTTNGTKVEIWGYHGGSNQQFTFTPTSGGYYRITPQNATGSCLDVSGVSKSEGAIVWLWSWLDGLNQQWSPQAP